MSLPLNCYRRPRVVCPSCNWSSDRMQREDGTFGTCNRCDTPMVRAFHRTERRIEKARAELRDQGAA